MTSEEFKDRARAEEEAFVYMPMNGGYAYIQWSDDEGCWDYYLWNENKDYEDGGQFETDVDGNELTSAYDALAALLFEEKDISDVDDEVEVTFIDPEDHWDFEEFC